MCKGGGLFVYRPGYKNVLIYLCVWLCIMCTYLRQVSGCGYFSVRAGAQLVRGLGGSIMKQPSGNDGAFASSTMSAVNVSSIPSRTWSDKLEQALGDNGIFSNGPVASGVLSTLTSVGDTKVGTAALT